MYHIDFNKPNHVHFIGIGGISMSGLAEILLERGFTVSGSDAHASELTKKLEEHGANVFYGQKAENIIEGIDVVVYTAAIHPDNPEYMAAEEKGLPMLSRADFLGQIMRNYDQSIAIAGTHGKTTTTSMVSQILMDAKKDPTITVGGMLDVIGGNIRVGGSELFVMEACEYTNSFLSFFPTIEVILNIEADHLDFFKDLDDIRHSFRRFAAILPDNGTLIINSDIENYEEICKGLSCKIVTVGSDPKKSHYSMANVVFDQNACASYDLLIDGKKADTVSLGVPGMHNVYNSLAAIAAAHEVGIENEEIKTGLLSYRGTHRRFEKKGELNGVTIIDDYAHHPQEIEAMLSTAKHYPHNEIWCVFQPHTYSRTKTLFNEFAEALSAADHVIVADIYAARETDDLGISSKMLAEKIAELGTDSYYLPSFEAIEKFIVEKCINGDLLITTGAGDIVKVGENLLSR